MRDLFGNFPARLFAALAAAGVLLVAACTQTANNGAPVLPAGPASVTALRYDPNELVPAPNHAWLMLPGTMHATFSRPPAHAVRLTMPYPQRESAAILKARAVVVSVTYGNGSTSSFPVPATFDASHQRATAEIPAALLERATGVTLALGVDNPMAEMETPGPRYWDGSVWKATGKIKSSVTTLVLIHGIFSSVEQAFPAYRFFTGCPQKIADAGGFKQVLGFDYDWTQLATTQGKLFGDFLKDVIAAKPTSLTIEAHSYGTLVTLSALPSLGSEAKVANAVLLGGPLPLRGTPLAKRENTWRISMMLGLLDWHFDYPPSAVDRMFDSGMVASLASRSDTLKGILNGINGMSNKPNFIEAAGTKWICFVGTTNHCAYSEETFKRVLTERDIVELPWDGVVETIAAASTAIPKPTATTFPASHIDLTCGSDVIGWVGKQLK